MKRGVPIALPFIVFAAAAYVFVGSAALPGGSPVPRLVFLLTGLLCLLFRGWGSFLILFNLSLYSCALHSPVPLVQAALGGGLARTWPVALHLAVWGALALVDVMRSGKESGRHGTARYATSFEARRTGPSDRWS